MEAEFHRIDLYNRSEILAGILNESVLYCGERNKVADIMIFFGIFLF